MTTSAVFYTEINRSTHDVITAIDCYMFLARDAFVRTNRRAIAMIFVRLSVCLSETGVHCDHTVHFSADLSLRWIFQRSGQPDTKACPPTPCSRLFQVAAGNSCNNLTNVCIC